ncbi:MAG: homogentisate phytyltransferase [Bacteroidota bacterium]
MKAITIFWQFSRPHTIIGSVISIVTLYTVALDGLAFTTNLPLLILAIICGICCNVFIVGINQIQDVAIDKINKPYLPIASGALSIKNAYRIIYTCTFISIAIAAYISFVLLGVIALSLLIGMAYSLPPFYFKKHHLPAAICISVVRGLLVNLGGFYVFKDQLYGQAVISGNVWLLTLFIVAFSISIAWFKDLPDIAGDAKYNIKTLAILYSPKFAFYCGTTLVATAYLFNLYFNWFDAALIVKSEYAVPSRLFYGHLILFTLFIINAFTINFKSNQSVVRFYKRFWLFFFAEYLLYFIAFIF